jgi:hypothetical protein
VSAAAIALGVIAMPIMLAILTAAAMQTAANQPITVIGQRLPDLQARLAACIARNCPADEDIDASLAVAEAQIVNGDYRDARRTLLSSLGRNKDEAASYPIPVSDLYRANGKVAAHLGIDDDYYRSTWGIYRTLKEGLPDEKYRQYSALMEVAEMMGRTRNHERARLYYERIADSARKDGRPDIAALAELRRVLRHYPPYARESAVRKILARTDPKPRAPVLEGKLALARMAYEDKDEAKGDAIVAELAGVSPRKPILVYAPAYDLGLSQGDNAEIPRVDRASVEGSSTGGPDGGGAQGGTGRTFTGAGVFGARRMALNVEDMWIDVGFRISPDGRVQDLEVLRSKGSRSWARPLLKSIAGRRYTPAAAGSPASRRKERYTFTSGLEAGSGTKAKQHSPNARVEYFDLSDINATD